MTIGFSNGCFYKLFPGSGGRISERSTRLWKLGNAIEFNCSNEEEIDLLISEDFDLDFFRFISLHAPALDYFDNKKSNRLLNKIKKLVDKINLKNVVVHPTERSDYKFLASYKELPISIENMDACKKIGKTLKEIKEILDSYKFKLTLDLQHCFTNDKTMQLALDFQNEFKDRIIEYHISGYNKELNHYPLFKTQQEVIINSIKFKNKPIMIESTFYDKESPKKEISYLKDKLFKNKKTTLNSF